MILILRGSESIIERDKTFPNTSFVAARPECHDRQAKAPLATILSPYAIDSCPAYWQRGNSVVAVGTVDFGTDDYGTRRVHLSRGIFAGRSKHRLCRRRWR